MKDKIALMTHQVIGYPDMKTNERALEIFEKNGIEYTELQIPFSDPSADGPTFVKANQESLNRGTTVKGSLEFIEKSVKKFDMNILIMTYYNIVYQYGVEVLSYLMQHWKMHRNFMSIVKNMMSIQ
jgi:tryptophan synthase alpha chain